VHAAPQKVKVRVNYPGQHVFRHLTLRRYLFE